MKEYLHYFFDKNGPWNNFWRKLFNLEIDLPEVEHVEWIKLCTHDGSRVENFNELSANVREQISSLNEN